jgi:hypothetical protein
MSTLEIDVGDIRPVSVAFTADELVVTLAGGRKIATPLAWYPRLRDASAAVRGRFDLMPIGIHWPELDIGIHWPELDEDLGIAGMLRGRPGGLRPGLPRAPTNPTGLRPATSQPEGMG